MPIISDRRVYIIQLIAFDILIERFNRPAYECLRLLRPVLPLGELEEHPTLRKQRMGEPLLQRSETVASLL